VQVKKIAENQKIKTIETTSNAISDFLETYVEKGLLKDYEISVNLSDDWPYTLDIEIICNPSPLASKELINDIIEKALSLGFEKAKEIFSEIGLIEV